MAACGVDCRECASYKVTVDNDIKAAEELVEWYRAQGWIGKDEGAEAVVAKNPLCKGCWNSDDTCFFKCGCNVIDFRECCNEKKIEHCGECMDFPCKYYEEWASWAGTHEKARERLALLRMNIQ